LNRVNQVVLAVSTLVFSWLGMQVVHEFGHMVHAWTSGGRVRLVVLHPLEISRTDVSPNPHPQFVAWGGPVWGSVIPVAIYGAVRWRTWSRAWLARFFAGFCLIANGGYLLGGCLFPVGDAEVLLSNGAPRMSLATFGVVALASGFALWNGIGRHFGLSRQPIPFDKGATWGMSAALVLLLVIELVISRS
jgi:hypothetical protein